MILGSSRRRRFCDRRIYCRLRCCVGRAIGGEVLRQVVAAIADDVYRKKSNGREPANKPLAVDERKGWVHSQDFERR